MAKRFTCPYCQRGFTSEDRYHAHVAKEHAPKFDDDESPLDGAEASA